jgi:hypothetical protein
MKAETAASNMGSHKAARSVMSDSPKSCYGTARILWRLAALALCGACAVAAHSENGVATQRALISQTVSSFATAPAPEGRGRVFFLGFAGYGDERVFAEEIKMAAQRVGERYGSTQRSLLLVNDRRDLKTLPLATHDNLRAALEELSRVMDEERDVLFLALSSHGSQDGWLEVSNTGMPPVRLRAETVARFLRETGIRWKVVVVSACYSGTFVEPLADNHTIVITAASRTRTSFGCSDERHLTYFGEAFYRDALPAAVSLRAAFEAARRDIRRREREERVQPSQPQSYFGPLIEKHLEDLD